MGKNDINFNERWSIFILFIGHVFSVYLFLFSPYTSVNDFKGTQSIE